MYEMYLGIFAGVVARAIFPFLVISNFILTIWDFDKYFVSAIVGLIISLIVSMMILYQLDKELSFGVAFVTAYTLHSVSREIQKAF